MKKRKRPAPLRSGIRRGWIVVHATTPTQAVGRVAHASRAAAIAHFCTKVRGVTTADWPQLVELGFSVRRVTLRQTEGA